MDIKKESQPKDIERTKNKVTYVPLTDIYEEENKLVLISEMPGVDEKNVDINLDKGVLLISGRISEEKQEGYRLLNREYRVGDYQRSFSISSDIDGNKIEAKIKNGVLTLILPKLEEKAKKIPVKIG